MSFTPHTPTPPPVQPAPPAPVMTPGPTPGRGARRLALVSLLAGVVGAIALLYAGATSVQGVVETFARGPVGCTTSLEFDHSGTYQVYAETKGRIATVDGDCPVVGDSEVPGGRASVEFLIVDNSGTPLTVRSADGAQYTTGDYAGELVATVEVPATGSYRLTVSGDQGAIIAVGGELGNGDLLILAGVGVGLVGVVLAIVLFMRGRRRDRAVPVAPVAAPWTPQQYAPHAPTVPQAPPMSTPPQVPPPPPGPGWGAPRP